MKCPIVPEHILRKLREERAARPPLPVITEESIIQALDPDNPYFITTSLYWECECHGNFVRSAGMNMCENCGAFRDECPDARLLDIKDSGTHVDWTRPEVIRTLDQYNTRFLRGTATA